jgi:hypothetical protein
MARINALLLEQCFAVPQSVNQDLRFDALQSLRWGQWGVKDAVDVVPDTSTAWLLPVTLDFSVRAADARVRWSAGHARGGRSSSRHGMG